MGLTNSDQETDSKPTIKLNKKMRLWNKYKTYIIGAVAVLLVVCIGAVVLKTLSNNSAQDQNTVAVDDTTEQNASLDQTTQAATQATTETTTQAVTQATQEATTVAAQTTTYTVSGSAQSEEFTTADFFSDAVFLGDSVMEGISYYGYLSSTQVIYNGNMTTDKAKDYVTSVASANPGKVFLMVGLNDINYGTRSADDIASLYSSLVSSIKSSCPNAKVYILSVLPVTSAFEGKSTNKITQAAVDALNAKLAEQAAAMGASYIDVSTAFKDGTGYMGSSFTGNGSNIYNEYYPFLLNGIAGVLK